MLLYPSLGTAQVLHQRNDSASRQVGLPQWWCHRSSTRLSAATIGPIKVAWSTGHCSEKLCADRSSLSCYFGAYTTTRSYCLSSYSPTSMY